ncbi:ogr/Delta-like zinc finger family protein [Sansalvadorimonas verongulae]|uniref:ogr/Delta-like zinc finger family protein n=1 Tax=Sansalvadorimonas verongulae TaxID=2172824 RepID=UPI0012BD0762|nr:transcriptional regulator [Sansalvadorimonas verongulae]
MTFRVKCNVCESKARIEHSDRISNSVSRHYCCCTNPLCGHTFVMNLEFSKTLSPSALLFTKEHREVIQTLNKQQLKEHLKGAYS